MSLFLKLLQNLPPSKLVVETKEGRSQEAVAPTTESNEISLKEKLGVQGHTVITTETGTGESLEGSLPEKSLKRIPQMTAYK